MLKFGNKEFRNLEEQVAYLSRMISKATDVVKNIIGIAEDADSLPSATGLPSGSTYAVGTEAPYTYYVVVDGVWENIGVFPLKGDTGAAGANGYSVFASSNNAISATAVIAESTLYNPSSLEVQPGDLIMQDNGYLYEVSSLASVGNWNCIKRGFFEGRGIDHIGLTSYVGLTDTYTIYYTDGTTWTYEVKNGQDGQDGDTGPQGPAGPSGIGFLTYGSSTFADCTAILNANRVPAVVYDNKVLMYAGVSGTSPDRTYSFYTVTGVTETTLNLTETTDVWSGSIKTLVDAGSIQNITGSKSFSSAPLPTTDGGVNLGSFARRWKDIYLDGSIKTDSNTSFTLPSTSGELVANPMTAQGDIIVGGTSGAPSKLAKGSSKQVLSMNSAGTDVEWAAPTPMTAKGDLIIGGVSGAASRLALGNAGQVLTVNAGETDVEWATPSAGADNIYFCTYGTTTAAQVRTALAANKIPVCIYNVGGNDLWFYLQGHEEPSSQIDDFTFVAMNSYGEHLLILDYDNSWTYRLTKIVWDPMTTKGDLIYSLDNSGTPYRLPIGTLGQALTVGGSSTPVWSNMPGGFYMCTYGTTTFAQVENAIASELIPVLLYNGNYLYTFGKIEDYGLATMKFVFFNTSENTNKRVAVDYNNTWTNNETKYMPNPMSGAGSIVYSSDATGTPASLGIGTQGQVLTVGSTGLPEWQASGGGGGGTQLYKHVARPDSGQNVALVWVNNISTPYSGYINTALVSCIDDAAWDLRQYISDYTNNYCNMIRGIYKDPNNANRCTIIYQRFDSASTQTVVPGQSWSGQWSDTVTAL